MRWAPAKKLDKEDEDQLAIGFPSGSGAAGKSSLSDGA